MAFSLDPETKIQATAILLECTEQSSRRLKLLQQYWQQREKKKRSAWVKPWLTRRKHQGHYDNLMKELREEDPVLYKNFLRLDEALFDEIVERLCPRIERKRTSFREPLEPGLRVAITLRYLATGSSYKTLSYAFRVSHSTISLIVPETCEAIVAEYGQEVMALPSAPEHWKAVADGFHNRWNFPHTIGAIDGKHVRIRCPEFGGSNYYNYKKFHSIILLAVVDSDYKFLNVDVGALGSGSDAGIFAHSSLRTLLDSNAAKLPPPEPLPGMPGTSVPYFFVGDDAFPLRSWLQKPFPQRAMTNEERIFNYRLSRARRVVENAFGILAARFRVFHTAIHLHPSRAVSVVMAACVLHNLLRLRRRGELGDEGDSEDPVTHEVIPGSWHSNPHNLEPLAHMPAGNHATQDAKKTRETLRDYCNSPAGTVAWQDRMI